MQKKKIRCKCLPGLALLLASLAHGFSLILEPSSSLDQVVGQPASQPSHWNVWLEWSHTKTNYWLSYRKVIDNNSKNQERIKKCCMHNKISIGRRLQ